MLKNLLNFFHALVKKLFHVILIPVMALIKGLIALLTHLETELKGF